MPIDIEQFESDPEGKLRAQGGTNAEVILSFLATSPDQAYTPKEIHEKTDIPRGSVGVVLSRLVVLWRVMSDIHSRFANLNSDTIRG